MEFSLLAVEEACRQWRRRDDGRRPTPGQIRALAAEEQEMIEFRARSRLPRIEKQPEPPPEPPTAEQIAEVDAIVARLTGQLQMPTAQKQDLEAEKARFLDELRRAG